MIAPKTAPDRYLDRMLGTVYDRGGRFDIVLDGAHHLAARAEGAALKAGFAPIAETLTADEKKIVDELIAVHGKGVDIGGYCQPDVKKVEAAMRPSAVLNGVLG